MRVVLIMSALILTSAPAMAQATSESEQCWNSSQRYSPGSSIRTGDGVYICKAAATGQPVWEKAADATGANCVYEDRAFTAGAVVAVKDAAITCQPDGTWVK